MPPHPQNFDSVSMARAIEIANAPMYSVLPNPRVGAVIVLDGKIIGEGFHRGPGLPHAEVEAIRDAQRKNQKRNQKKHKSIPFHRCEIFVSLEPCSHTKKRTPPCAPLLIEKKFRRVVVASLDPNPQVSGRGIAAIKKAGIKTEVGALEDRALMLNQAFFKNQLKKSAYVTLKIATTFDGKMADDFGKSKWITGEESRAQVQILRAQSDGIIVGKSTIEKDDPSLNIRIENQKAKAQRVLIFGLPKNFSKRLKVFKANGAKNIFVVASKKKRDKIEKAGATWIPKEASLKTQVASLYKNHGFCSLLLEGGAKLASSFLRESCVDELVLFMGRGILGGAGRYSLGQDWGLIRLGKSISFRPENIALLDGDIRIQGRLNVYGTHRKSR